MSLQEILLENTKKAIAEHYGQQIENIEIQLTRKEFEGDYTIVLFPLLKLIKAKPEQIGEVLGAYLTEHVAEVTAYNVVKGFLNLTIADSYFLSFFGEIAAQERYGTTPITAESPAMIVEYSSPNTNKPLHLGHIRNNLLGFSMAKILEATGKRVYKTQIINDRGIHICKSMIAWQLFGKGETPESTGLKGDKLVGKYYVLFENELKKQTDPICKEFLHFNFSSDKTNSQVRLKRMVEEFGELEIILKREEIYNLISQNIDIEEIDKIDRDLGDIFRRAIEKEYINKLLLDFKKKQTEEFLKSKKFKEVEKYIKPLVTVQDKIATILLEINKIARQNTSIMHQAQQLLRLWEQGDAATLALWKQMNQWVYDGFEVTYRNLGVSFDRNYYESETYLLGKDIVQRGLEQGVFYRKEDGSVWIDLTADGLDEKLVLRSDGTSVYITQDLGTATKRIEEDFPKVEGMIYTVGNEQDYHFKVLFLILQKLGFAWAKNLYHLSYGMVELPNGKMKSREGTVVDADDLMEEMVQVAEELSQELGKLDGYTQQQKQQLYRVIGLGALKYYILKVDPKKKIAFNPQESIDFQGNTGPFIQYTYARIQSILRKAGELPTLPTSGDLHPKERELIKQLSLFTSVVQQAADTYSPALIANYVYELVKEFNSFYQNVSILGEEDPVKRSLRIHLSRKVGEVIATGFDLLGIEVPERM
ncbi:arginine--tRNA ligase [Capnocytophaga gingivalis]|uniref:Arginine--tRNA ligase n=1 Tax=Capnocytophaga gingivalis TaxID=1017 RepID=A0ABU5ZAV3_9FLAO|nr:arginine--tRNA ligase [Capnocytophaga gingivalis]MEB3076091.1 arginine--tRNA ligase [Capnocytophaga gingivalis]